MKVLGKKEVYKGKYLKVIKKDYLTKDGKRGSWECVERKGAVIIFPLTEKKEVILERIFRIPLNSYSIELPAGMIDKKKETPRETAKRELLEETGYLAKKLILISKNPVDSGLSPNELIFFFAPNVKFLGKTKILKPDDAEEIEVIKVPLKKLVDFLMNPPKKTKVDFKILSAIPILKKKKLI